MSARPTVAMLEWLERIRVGRITIYKRHTYSMGLSMHDGEKFVTPPRFDFIESMVQQRLVAWTPCIAPNPGHVLAGLDTHYGFEFKLTTEVPT